MKRTKDAARPARGRVLLAATALLAALATAQAGSNATTYSMDGSVIAGGGGIGAANCYTLVSTIGEPVAGTVASDGFTLTSGFLAAVGPTGDALFKDGFEANTGACK